MTADEILILSKLKQCSYFPGSWAKRFIMDLAQATADTVLSEKQSEWIYRVLYMKRKSVPYTYNQFKHHKWCKKAPKENTQPFLPPVAGDWNPQRTKGDFKAKIGGGQQMALPGF